MDREAWHASVYGSQRVGHKEQLNWTDYIHEFWYGEPTLHSLQVNKFHLVIVCNSSYMLPDFVCNYPFEEFCNDIHKRYWSVVLLLLLLFFPLVMSLSGIGIRYISSIHTSRTSPLLFFRTVCESLLLLVILFKYLVEFSSDALWTWTFLCVVFDYCFNLFTWYRYIQIMYLLSQFQQFVSF